MINFSDGELLNLLGGGYQTDPEIQSLSYAVQQGVKQWLKCLQSVTTFSDIDSVTAEQALDLAAAENQLVYYDPSLDIDTKKELIKRMNRWNMIAGTKAAVEEIATDLFGDCTVEEWPDYSGQPYHFRVVTSIPASSDNVGTFNRLISRAKNLRSYLDSVSILRTLSTQGSHSVGLRLTVVSLPPIYCV